VGLRFDPMGGGQLKQALNAIVEAEKQPINALNKRKESEQAKMKLFGEFKGKFTSLQSAVDAVSGQKRFRELKAELGEGDKLMAVTIDKEKAQIGSWEVEVREMASRSSMISNSFSDPNQKVLGIGYINLELNNGEFRDIYVTEQDASLYGIAQKINTTPDSVVKASVLRDDTNPDKPYRLVLTSKKDGLSHDIYFPQLYFIDGSEEFSIDDTKRAQNGLVAVDGFEIETPGNEVGDFLQGVGVQFKQAKPGEKFTLNIKADYVKITDKVKKMVEGVNGVLEWVNKQNQVDEKTDTRTTFAGNTSLQNVEFRLRNLMHEGFPTHMDDESKFKVVHLSDIGIEFDKKGNLSIKEDKFQKMLETDYEAIAEVISGEKGFAFQLKTVLDGFNSPQYGVISSSEKSIQERIRQIDQSIERKQMNLEKKTQSLTEQFSRLQSSLSNMQKQQQYLSATLGGGGGNPISQLLGG
jgi:flagellar hook-associated protein 2